MFYYLYDLYFNHLDSLRIFSYVTFRALMAGLTSMLVTFWFGHKIIDFLYGLKFRESVRDDGPKSHEIKKGTPTMGGLLIIGSLLISVLLWGNLKNPNVILLSVFSLSFSVLGFADDYMKSVKKIKGGMRARTKFILSILISFIFCILFFIIQERLVKLVRSLFNLLIYFFLLSKDP
ncbi:phospho-N-acetylmuramoyl-pentapeptide-transferase signature 1 [Leptospira interrogans serovar Australis str. 200703203]|uniref:Phospho-N-acetylmuramoyl-pentapeptide-transferase signature 1 n=1 Tax=Leptospira interrogans serovar Australis str. 200703203 TaxID=1085541 RepID=N1UNJ7_LEPIR|nr:phospho-N-acetylmuramoyl-pentapeptide-transferase signature 1 [Leptospira interrogans serovar Australis str. 200703203]